MGQGQDRQGSRGSRGSMGSSSRTAPIKVKNKIKELNQGF